MIILYYIILAYLALQIGKIEKRVNVAMYSSMVSVPLAILTMVGLSILAIIVLPLAIKGLVLIGLLLWKLHVFLKVKLLAIIGGIIGWYAGYLPTAFGNLWVGRMLNCRYPMKIHCTDFL